MALNSELFYDIKNRLNDWLRITGGDVSNRPLDLLNRAQNWLTEYKRWTDMMHRVELTPVAGSSTQFTLPSDMASFTIVNYDSDSDGKPDKYYYRHARHHDGYEITDNFDKSTGHSWVITFYLAPEYTPEVYYQKRLEDFVDYDTAAEHTANPQYTFFPGELLLRAAQVIHIEETGLVSAEVQIIQNSLKNLLENYEQAHHNVNNDLRMEILDDSGERVWNEASSLMGDFGSYYSKEGYENDVDF